MQTRPPLIDTAGRPLQIGSELGSGGEGSVFALRDRSDLVVKLYHKALDPDKAIKIASMAKSASERLLKLTAWPTDPIRAGSKSGPVIGFTMPKITGHKQAFSLYLPKLRLQEFPKATWPFLIRSAANAARAFNVIHETGHVIGDVNHGNLFVGDQATVRLIDCDSYQIAINGSRWLCEVGVATHQPPELQNLKTYKGVIRTPNHDNFGLAVIIFQMLFMARHPFFGRFHGSGEMPMERAISEYRFVYGPGAAAMHMEPPPATLRLNGVTRDMAVLFERAFSRQGSQPSGRPTAREWVTALQDLEAHLKKCSVNPAHQFVDTLTMCPWCDIEAVSGVPLFLVALVGSAQTGFTIAEFWGKVISVRNPGPSPVLPRVEGRTVSLSPAALELQQATWGMKTTSGLFALVGGTTRVQTLNKELEKNLTDARNRWQNLQINWNSYTSSKDFDDLHSVLRNLRTLYDGIPQKRVQALQQLEADRYRLQLHSHLDSCRISHAKIRRIGDTRKAMLQSYGIETAADISDRSVLAVPGFGPVALNNLKSWRNQQERRFRFDPNKGVDQAAKNTVERKIITERIDLERKLNEALSKLSVSSHHILTRRQTLLVQAEQASLALAQAEADVRATRRPVPVANPAPASITARTAAPAVTMPSVTTPSVTTPSPKRNGKIIWWGIVAIGGLFVAANYSSHGPSYPVPPRIIATGPAAISPAPPARPVLPPHVVTDLNGQRQPSDGYDWSDSNHTSVKWSLGKVSKFYPHVVASDTEGDWQPEDGYDWVNPNNRADKTVRWVPTTPSARYPNVLTGPVEGQWRPANGYTWVLNPPQPGDMRVRPIGSGDTSTLQPSPAASYQQGMADRAALEQWVSDLTGDFRRGSDWWAARRSVPNPGTCNSLVGASPDFVWGCEAAKARLTPVDIKRKSDPEYRRGWNTYSGPPPNAPVGAPMSLVPVPTPMPDVAPGGTDVDPSDRLNSQELRRLRGR
jgi:DNA-binding helix-hairpin-helix protein with protein kinase domain